MKYRPHRQAFLQVVDDVSGRRLMEEDARVGVQQELHPISSRP